jgi:hypothetical protein
MIRNDKIEITEEYESVQKIFSNSEKSELCKCQDLKYIIEDNSHNRILHYDTELF